MKYLRNNQHKREIGGGNYLCRKPMKVLSIQKTTGVSYE